jgi:hypothetical protein
MIHRGFATKSGRCTRWRQGGAACCSKRAKPPFFPGKSSVPLPVDLAGRVLIGIAMLISGLTRAASVASGNVGAAK